MKVEAVDDVFNTLQSRRNQLNIIHAARSAKKDFLLDYLNRRRHGGFRV